MQAPDVQLQPHPEVVFTRLDSTEAVLLHLDTTRYYSLNETGARLWELCQDGRSAQEIAGVFQEEYDVGPADALSAVLECLDALRQEGLVQPATAEDRG